MICKIIIGVDPLKAMAYYVGQKAGDSVVDSIILDDKYLIKYSVPVVQVHVINFVQYLYIRYVKYCTCSSTC